MPSPWEPSLSVESNMSIFFVIGDIVAKKIRIVYKKGMLISATLSKPSKGTEEKLGRPYVKIRIWKNPSPAAQKNSAYISEAFTEKQSFTKNLSEK